MTTAGIKKTGKVTAPGGLSLRFEPAVRDGNILTLLSDGALVAILDSAGVNSEGLLWYCVDTLALGVGFVEAQHVQMLPNTLPTPPLNPAPVGQVGSTKRVGLHVLQDGVNTALRFAQAHKLPSVTILNDQAVAAAMVTAGVGKVIYRYTPTGNYDNITPSANAVDAAKYGAQMVNDRWMEFADLNPQIYIQPVNEGLWTTGSDAFWLAVMKAFDAKGRKAAIGAYAVGQVEPTQWFQMAASLRYAQANGHIMSLHAYCAPGTAAGKLTGSQSQYYETRFKRLYAAVPADCQPRLVLGEFGGEFSRGQFQGTEALINLCTAFESAIGDAPYLDAYNLWTVGGLGGWANCDISGALDKVGTWVT